RWGSSTAWTTASHVKNEMRIVMTPGDPGGHAQRDRQPRAAGPLAETGTSPGPPGPNARPEGVVQSRRRRGRDPGKPAGRPAGQSGRPAGRGRPTDERGTGRGVEPGRGTEAGRRG